MVKMSEDKQRAIGILENLWVDVGDFLDEMEFEYQHSPNYGINSNAFSKQNDTGEWIMSCCPNHSESKASFGISKEAPYHANCFYCGYLGTIDKVVEIAFDLEEGAGIQRLLSNFVTEEQRKPLDLENIIEDGRNPGEIPCLGEDALTRFEYTNSPDPYLYGQGMSYLINSRGMTMHTIETYGIKVDIENKCIVFPQRTRKGELRFIQKRKIGDDFSGVKFINEGTPIKKDILFGLHFIENIKTSRRIKRIRLVESPLDVMSNYQVGIPAAAQNGKILFQNQIRELQLAGIEIVDLLYDDDPAGKSATDRATKDLIKHGFVVNHVMYPSVFAPNSGADSNLLLKLGWLDKLHTYPVSSLGSKTI